MNCNMKGKKSTIKSFQFIALLLFVFAAVSSIKAQAVGEKAYVGDQNGTETRVLGAASGSNFILWFMGTKDNMDVMETGRRFNTKKSIMTSGIVPNRLLLKTLMKKTINIESC